MLVSAMFGCGDEQKTEFPAIAIPSTPRPTDAPLPDPCHDEATLAECQTCLEAANEDGAKQLRTTFLNACACGEGAQCALHCKPPPSTNCADFSDPSSECQTCLDLLPAADAPCVADALDQCQRDGDCAALLRSLDGCPAPEEPEADAGAR